MGKMMYGSPAAEFDIEDRALAHLKVAIVTKLRRDEKFTFSWRQEHGRTTIWIHPSIPLQFVFAGSRPPALNRAWIEALMMSANSTGGLQLVPEPEEQS
jgi:hypothetical protein